MSQAAQDCLECLFLAPKKKRPVLAAIDGSLFCQEHQPTSDPSLVCRHGYYLPGCGMQGDAEYAVLAKALYDRFCGGFENPGRFDGAGVFDRAGAVVRVLTVQDYFDPEGFRILRQEF